MLPSDTYSSNKDFRFQKGTLEILTFKSGQQTPAPTPEATPTQTLFMDQSEINYYEIVLNSAKNLMVWCTGVSLVATMML